MNLQYFENPLENVQNNNSVYCPYIKINNKFINTPVPQAQHLNGESVKKLCVPNLSDRMMIPGYGFNYCYNNQPVHLNFNEKSDCYSSPGCNEKDKITHCMDPYMHQ